MGCPYDIGFFTFKCRQFDFYRNFTPFSFKRKFHVVHNATIKNWTPCCLMKFLMCTVQVLKEEKEGGEDAIAQQVFKISWHCLTKILMIPKAGWAQQQGGENGRRGLWLQIHHLPVLDMQNISVETIYCCRLKELFNHMFYQCCFQNVLMCPKMWCKFHLLGGMEAQPSQWWTAISPRAVQMKKKGTNSWSRMMTDEKRKL